MNRSLLVVDDEPGIRDLICFEFARRGDRVATAADGDEALERIRHAEYEVVVTDLRMPGRDGISLLRAIKERAPETEVVVVTGFADVDDAVECIRHGAFEFLQKPFDVRELAVAVDRAAERRRLRQIAGLHEAGRAILDDQETHRRPERIVELALRALDADHAALWLADGTGHPHVAHERGRDSRPDGGPWPDAALVERVVASGAPAWLGAVDGEAGSCLVHPLRAGPRVVGTLAIGRAADRPPFGRPDLERAAVLASLVLLSLENARLVGEVAASERLASVGLLAAGIGHEIASPIGAILTNHALLRHYLGELPRFAGGAAAREAGPAPDWPAWSAEVEQIVGDLGECANRIAEITRDLKSLARVDEPHPVLFDVNQAIRSALRIAGAELRKRAVVTGDLAPDLLVLGQPGRLSQVFVNLLVNAGQALDEAGPGPREVRVRSWSEGDRVVATVEDTGPGIAPAHLPRIFEPFFTTKAAGVGTGLGLAIARDMVRNQGGELRADSTPGHGATFTVSLPAAGADAPPGGSAR